MRFHTLLLFALLCTCARAQSMPSDSLLSSVLWEETTPGQNEGYLLRLDRYGSFEEDAGEGGKRAARYLMGRWEVDSASTSLTLAVDYFLGQKMVPKRYRRGQDFYLEYRIIARDSTTLELEDKLTGKTRSFVARPLAGREDAAERTAREIDLGRKDKGLKLPKGW